MSSLPFNERCTDEIISLVSQSLPGRTIISHKPPGYIARSPRFHSNLNKFAEEDEQYWVTAISNNMVHCLNTQFSDAEYDDAALCIETSHDIDCIGVSLQFIEK